MLVWDIGSSSVDYIFHKGLLSYVLGGYEVQMNMYIFDFERKSIFNRHVIYKLVFPTLTFNM